MSFKIKQHDLFLNLTHVKVHVSFVFICHMSNVHNTYRTIGQGPAQV